MKTSVALLGAGVITATSAMAHHGFGTFAMNEDIELSGVVTSLDFVNPHSWLNFNVTGADGQIVEYRCEMRSATTLRRSGWKPEMFPPGTVITIQGSPDRVDPKACYVSTLVLEEEGTSLDRYGQLISATPTGDRAARLPNGEPNISGDWAVEQRIMTDPKGRDGTLVPLSEAANFEPGGVPEGQREIPGARGTAEAEIDRSTARPRPPARAAVSLTPAGEVALQALADIPRAELSCTTGSIVSDWGGEPVNRVTQAADTIVLQYGLLGLERTIHMGMRTHPADIVPSRAGHSIGWWSNDVLVVDTVGFLPGTLTRNTPHSEQLHVVERFSLDTGTGAVGLKREYTADDPAFFVAPLSGSEVSMVSNVPYNPEPCVDLTPVVDPG
jgi:hypothetical protein